MMPNFHKAIVKWRGQPIEWCEYGYNPDNQSGYVVLHTVDGHEVIHEPIEIFIDGRLVYHSPDLWHRGFMRPY